MLIRLFLKRRSNKKMIKSWRKNNRHNKTTIAVNGFNHGEIIVGKNTYGELNVYNDTKNKLIIGNYCSIAEGVKFLVGIDHNVNNISTYPYKVLIMGNETEAISKGDIIIEDDVWIGNGAMILSGVKIGQGAVVAAGAVVVKNVEPYTIVGGIPAKILKYRFNPEIIEVMKKIDYSQLSEELIKNHIEELYTELKSKEQLEKLIKWMPKKI